MFTIENRKLIRGFKAHITTGLGGAADYQADYEDIISPVEGIVRNIYTGNEGGKWLHITDEQGRSWQFAHLSEYAIGLAIGDKIIKGQFIATSGNTGSITSGPHIHLQIVSGGGVRLDPEIIIKEILSMSNYENKIVRNSANGEYAFVLNGKRRIITAARAGFAAITAIDRGLLKDDIISITEADYKEIPSGDNF